MLKEKISIYIHYPFCKSLCPYCDFNSYVAESVDTDEWVEAYIKELEYFLPHFEGKLIPSIFFGGGTPSLMAPDIVYEIISFLKKHAKLENPEITLEANPTSSEAKKFALFKDAGINRLSLGIQSLRDDRLKILGRQHNAQEAIGAIELARENFDNYSFDLIYATPNQTIENWQEELEQALKLSSNHISLYQLTIEKGTPFYKLHKDKKLIMPDQELSADLYDLTNEILTQNGYDRYEISNYAKQGYESLHNIGYWKYQDYIGIGPGAHSRVTLRSHCEERSDVAIQKIQNGSPRFARDDIANSAKATNAIMTHHNPQKWLKSVFENGNGVQTNKELSDKEIITEIIMMGLRIKEGISLGDFKSKTGRDLFDIIDRNYLKTLIESNLAELDSSLKLTSSGVNLHSYIVPRLLCNL